MAQRLGVRNGDAPSVMATLHTATFSVLWHQHPVRAGTLLGPHLWPCRCRCVHLVWTARGMRDLPRGAETHPYTHTRTHRTHAHADMLFFFAHFLSCPLTHCDPPAHLMPACRCFRTHPASQHEPMCMLFIGKQCCIPARPRGPPPLQPVFLSCCQCFLPALRHPSLQNHLSTGTSVRQPRPGAHFKCIAPLHPAALWHRRMVSGCALCEAARHFAGCDLAFLALVATTCSVGSWHTWHTLFWSTSLSDRNLENLPTLVSCPMFSFPAGLEELVLAARLVDPSSTHMPDISPSCHITAHLCGHKRTFTPSHSAHRELSLPFLVLLSPTTRPWNSAALPVASLNGCVTCAP